LDGSWDVAVLATAYRVPDRVVTSDEVQDRVLADGGLRLPKGLVEQVTGIVERRQVQPGTLPSDLAAIAGQDALQRAGVDTTEVDLLIHAANARDLGEPATANMVQELLGARRAAVFDIANGCNAFLTAMSVARAMLCADQYKTALLVCGEVTSASIDYCIADSRDLKTKFAGLTLGDGGAAMVLRRVSPGACSPTLGSIVLASAGEHWRISGVRGGGILEYGDLDNPSNRYFYCDSSELQRVSEELFPGVLERGLTGMGWSKDAVDHVIPHQVSLGVVDALRSLMGNERATYHDTLTRFGNTGAASMGIALASAQHTISSGERVLLAGVASGWSGGVGCLTW
jgi:3-oxoacyl-[acyl-carrier-protein] synthase-3